MIKARPNLALMRVRYEINNAGPMHLELRNDKRPVVYTERKRETHFVGDYDIAFLPAGDYTLHLSNYGFLRVEALRLSRSKNSIATVQAIELNTFQISSQSLFSSVVTN